MRRAWPVMTAARAACFLMIVFIARPLAPIRQLGDAAAWMPSVQKHASVPVQPVQYKMYQQEWSSSAHKSRRVSSLISLRAVSILLSLRAAQHWQIQWASRPMGQHFFHRHAAVHLKRPSLPRIIRSLSGGPPRLEALTAGTGDYAVGWKRPSNSPTIPRPFLHWLAGNAHPTPSKSPSVPIRSPSITRLDGQSGSRDDSCCLLTPLCFTSTTE